MGMGARSLTRMVKSFIVLITTTRRVATRSISWIFEAKFYSLSERKVRPKQLSSGVMLGDDVLTLVVEPQMDHSLVMALVAVYGLMTDKI
ncbi:LURP-one-like protein [Actinidia rufa]|uniref:LURP-one-like protein n=1 Tax=Actinidia rufa TaxID=165716 RepID=A0A7J0FF58_9ERIC|nr:LURP-one-like protein [Actinidia rufa]